MASREPIGALLAAFQFPLNSLCWGWMLSHLLPRSKRQRYTSDEAMACSELVLNPVEEP
jgi:hypothetical protein